MVMPTSATFHYVTEIPHGVAQASPWQMKSVESFKASGDWLFDCRLVGWEPLLFVNDAGMTPNPSASRPSVWRSELRLVATDTNYAAQPTISYFADKALIHAMRQGDVFHIAQKECGGLGASAIRQGKLIFAVGRVTAVPLGSGISARIPSDLLEEAQEVLRRRDSEFEFPELPIELCIGDTSRIIYQGHVEMAGYHVRVENAFQVADGAPGECVSISLAEACDWVAASATAQLLKMA
jgi:hypothetical protein